MLYITNSSPIVFYKTLPTISDNAGLKVTLFSVGCLEKVLSIGHTKSWSLVYLLLCMSMLKPPPPLPARPAGLYAKHRNDKAPNVCVCGSCVTLPGAVGCAPL